jgi:hypothetical protein
MPVVQRGGPSWRPVRVACRCPRHPPACRGRRRTLLRRVVPDSRSFTSESRDLSSIHLIPIIAATPRPNPKPLSKPDDEWLKQCCEQRRLGVTVCGSACDQGILALAPLPSREAQASTQCLLASAPRRFPDQPHWHFTGIERASISSTFLLSLVMADGTGEPHWEHSKSRT